MPNTSELTARQRSIYGAVLLYLSDLGLARKRGPETVENVQEVLSRDTDLQGDRTPQQFLKEIREVCQKTNLCSAAGMMQLGEEDRQGMKTNPTLTNNVHQRPGASLSMTDSQWDDLVRQYRALWPHDAAAFSMSHERPAPCREALLAEALLAGRPVPGGKSDGGAAQELNAFGLWGSSPAALSLNVETAFVRHHLTADRAAALAGKLLAASGGAR